MNRTHEKRGRGLDRREFLKATALGGLAFVAAGPLAGNPAGLKACSGRENETPVMSPNEDLMQEHALLNRVLLIYEEAARRLEGQKTLDPDVLAKSAKIIRHFIEKYHEKLEEDYVFPRFERAGKLLELVSVLRAQHEAGRALTERIISVATPEVFSNPAERKKLAADLSSFVRMYRPHEAREGSVLFPAFRELMPAREFQGLGEMFEKKEHELLGPEGFEGQVQVVASLEKQLGIHELSRFSPATHDNRPAPRLSALDAAFRVQSGGL
jgi:hemerythrin-like domain-containing protein